MDKHYLSLINQLQQTPIDACIHTDRATRICCASDNSIHHKIPHAVIYPKNSTAIVTLMHIIQQQQPGTIEIACRGGGSSTCGQSLTGGLVLDCSRHMNQIVDLDLKKQWIKVQPGCRPDAIGQTLKKHGYYFPVRISSSAQATFGGMVNTDAAGMGSFRHGRMHQHVLAMQLILVDSSVIEIYHNQRAKVIRPGIASTITVDIQSAFKACPTQPIHQARHLSGYNIFHPKSCQSLIPIICGSEGTLAVIGEITLSIKPLPKDNWLSIFYFKQLNQALEFSKELIQYGANAIEFLDKNILNQIRQHQPQRITQSQAKAMLLVEWHKPPPDNFNYSCLHQVHEKDPDAIDAWWGMRKQAVGWASQRTEGDARAIAFIEDMAVDPKHFHAFVQDVSKTLTKQHIPYAMYGHADAGCLHVRPILNPHQDMNRIIDLTKIMIKLLKKYEGCLCGEHGHGYRSEWVGEFFAPKQINLLKKIKQAFDPHNQLCRGQIISTNKNYPIKSMHQDLLPTTESIKNKHLLNNFLLCNGNARCLNQNPNEIICPSYHISHNPLHSPRSRALMLKDYWLNPNDPSLINPLLESLEHCLGCHACTKGGCPMAVNIPSARADFYQHHFNNSKHRRPKYHHILSRIELILARTQHISMVRRLANWAPIHRLIQQQTGLTALPKPSLHCLPIPKKIKQKSDKNTIYLLPDMLNTYFQPKVIDALIQISNQIGHRIEPLPYYGSGIVADGLGQYKIRDKQLKAIPWHQFKQSHIIVIEPSVALFLKEKARSQLSKHQCEIISVQQWLTQHLTSSFRSSQKKHYHLFPHCHEQALDNESIPLWVEIFARLGQSCQIHQTSCCGMAGIWGLQRNKQEASKACFTQHIKPHQKKINPNDIILNTGFSCLMQNKRYSKHHIMHPLLAIAKILIDNNNEKR